MIRWGVKLAVIVKTSTNVHPDAESTWKGFNGAWLRPYSPMEVVVTDEGSEFQGVFEQKVEGMSVFQQVEHGSTLGITDQPCGAMPPSRSTSSWPEKASNYRQRLRRMS